MAAIRRASVSWNGNLMTGKGVVSADSSEAFQQLPVTWASRTENPDGRTSPEELIAAAHASCYVMAFSAGLGKARTPPESLDVSAVVTFAQVDGGFKVVSSALTVKGVVPGISEEDFHKAAQAAKDGCPVSQALKGNVELSVDATLISS